VEEGRITSAALAFGGLAPLPWRDARVEAALIGNAPGMEVFAAAAEALLADARGFGANDFNIPLARSTLIACLRELTRCCGAS
jgi:xanthine dehydrogenase YagS FAD-binding subunit